MILIAAYIPPYGSKYSSVDMFQTLSDVLLDFDPDTSDVLLCGDFNAHVALKNDIAVFDANVCEHVDLDYYTINTMQVQQLMSDLQLPLQRSNIDKRVDKSGYDEALIQLCRNHMICIFNGRVGSDKGVGKSTTTENSIMDYVIGSVHLMQSVSHFQIHDFDPIFSDKHCTIAFDISLLMNLDLSLIIVYHEIMRVFYSY